MRARLVLTAAAAGALIACDVDGPPERLHVPSSAPLRAAIPGLQPLKLGGSRDGLLYVPTTYVPGQAIPLVILLHGAGGSAANWFGSYADRAEAAQVVLLAPDSRGSTWDAIHGRIGDDVKFINRALELVADEVKIDRDRMALVGFSDGASYALSLGLANGDLFGHVVAYSPGFYVTGTRRGNAKYFVTHGTADAVLPIDRASRAIAGIFHSEGFDVEYVEFDGGHEVPSPISTRAMSWLLAEWAH
jgi:phospholipase/carboxylesterase